MFQPMVETTGPRLFEICPRYFRLRYKPCHDSGSVEGTPVLSDEEFERASEEIEAIASDAVPVLA